MQFKPNTIAYSYIRMSTAKQLEGNSLARQMDLSVKFVRKHGLVLDESLNLTDIGKSGFSGANLTEGALGRFLELVRTGRIAHGSILLVESLDRLSRQHPLDAQVILVSILNAGIDVVTIEDEQHYSSRGLRDDWTKLILILAKQARAHEESQRKSDLAHDALAKRRADALEGKGKFSHIVPGWIGQTKRSRHEIDYELNDHADTIRLIFELSKSGMGQMAIAKEVNRRGLKPMRASSNGWHQTVVGDVLDNHATYGVFVPRKRVNGKYEQYADAIPDYYPAVIDKETFLAAQRNRQRKVNRGRKGDRFTNLFNGLTTCIHCGGSMTINYKGPKNGGKAYLRCYNNLRGNNCTVGKKVFMYEALEAVALDTIREFGISDYAGNFDIDPKMKELDEVILSSRAMLAEIEAKEINLVSQLAMVSAASAQVLHKALDQMQVDKAAAQKRLDEAEKNKSILIGSQDDFSDADAAIRKEREAWPGMSEAELYQSRSRINATLKYLYDLLVFDSVKGTASLVFANGLFAYHFKDGKLDSVTDAIRDGIAAERGGVSVDKFKTGVSEERKKVITNFIMARNKKVAGAKNPRLNDSDVVALKAKRKAAIDS
ncbi:recombinase family protein [Rhizobium sp. XQZ8]|uniref:recombinase family protein n=1 Tax=Rhizobium populisoli TaxID=2859785 RepID=UPI001C6633DA|nr:recombinase family protein [Rhizobium populisoli]MBW6421600.1 recombinase family protein [Rhizobium populisoli]